jgi:hypothetical protein
MTRADARGALRLRETAPQMSKNLKTALVLTSVVIAFFVGVIIRHWLWPSS